MRRRAVKAGPAASRRLNRRNPTPRRDRVLTNTTPVPAFPADGGPPAGWTEELVVCPRGAGQVELQLAWFDLKYSEDDGQGYFLNISTWRTELGLEIERGVAHRSARVGAMCWPYGVVHSPDPSEPDQALLYFDPATGEAYIERSENDLKYGIDWVDGTTEAVAIAMLARFAALTRAFDASALKCLGMKNVVALQGWLATRSGTRPNPVPVAGWTEQARHPTWSGEPAAMLTWVDPKTLRRERDAYGSPYDVALGFRLYLWRYQKTLFANYSEMTFVRRAGQTEWVPASGGADLDVRFRLDPRTMQPAADDLRKMTLPAWVALQEGSYYAPMLARMEELGMLGGLRG